MDASSQMMRSVLRMRSANFIPLLMSQIESSSTSIGIRNLECEVRPFGSSKDATPDEAIVSTIFLCALKYAIIVFHRNVFPVPPCPMTKKNLVPY
ncbi:hypothetical protein GQ55_4G015700 [Panicum hallii var. hallii]|uniref:Uncharacterized protein n=1 Tax=Panicum hallii var. hallii TaxID=1504633 RepID=A0A2T7DU78_9POAL|nr:hypothetical protein GQ55_4G015700 [Panicum hallii var. hallii]